MTDVAAPKQRKAAKAKGVAHPIGRYNDIQIRNLRTGTYADGQGLYIRVAATGGKCWFLRVMRGGERHDIGLGGYPLVSLSKAREKAHSLRTIAKEGGDFMKESRKGREVVTFEAIARAYHAKNAPTWKNAKATASWITSMEAYAFPMFKAKPIGEISQSDCLRVLGPIWTTKKEVARKLSQRLGLIFDYAKAHGHRTGDSPMTGFRHGLEKQNAVAEHHAALPFVQIAEFIAALRGRANAKQVTRLSVEWLILTATRVGETRFAAWSEINLATKTWTIPAARMKADKDHTIPLSDRCMAILEEAKGLADATGLIFPGGKGKAMSEVAHLNCIQSLGFVDENGARLTAHGMRSTFRDWAGDNTAADRETIEHCLAHQLKDRVEAAYRRSTAVAKRTTIMQAWADYATGKPVSGDVDLAVRRIAG
jgi:integrase